MKHLSEEQIVLHFYDDADNSAEVREHLSACEACRTEFERVSALLTQIVPIEVPEPHESFEQKIWLNVRDRLPERQRVFFERFLSPPKWVLAGVMAMVVAGAFFAGRYWPRPKGTPTELATNREADVQRGVLVAVADHLDRSQILLIEIMHAEPGDVHEFPGEQARARDLLDSNRLYRVSAQRAGDPATSRTLDDLERVLAEIANGPSELTEADLQRLQRQIQSQGLLFKIHIIGSKAGQEQRSHGELPGNQRL
ncbi:MAG TPA: hypothetical protein VN176_07920 [Verrucomicrobiae bacterium]|jgi:predicted anti-sigma-YlaC factor YlaD|nr:hypothetical protein [Verrucomicrobiae bacterium]